MVFLCSFLAVGITYACADEESEDNKPCCKDGSVIISGQCIGFDGKKGPPTGHCHCRALNSITLDDEWSCKCE